MASIISLTLRCPCTYLKGHLLGRAREVYFLGSENVEDFLESVDNNIKFLEMPMHVYLKGHLLGRAREVYFWGSENVEDFLESVDNNIKFLEMPMHYIKSWDLIRRKKLWWIIFFVRLELQVQDYVEVRNPTTTAKLLQIMAKFEEWYSYKEMEDARSSENMGRRDWDVRRMFNDDGRRRKWRWKK
ncbi:UNVERIFIED_CONTAM: hypothetical protein NCL1_22208 [Trichonephila clavipes]